MIPHISEHESVEAVLHKYVECVTNADAALVAEIFHPKALLSGYLFTPDGPADGVFIAENAVELLASYMKEAPPVTESSPNYTGKIIATEIFGRLATALVVEEDLEGRDFINHFQLQKVDGRWFITSKVLVSEPARPKG